MTPDTFTLQHSDIPQPVLLDIDPVTTVWPMPPVRPYTPAPRQLTLVQRWKLNKARRQGI